MAGFDEYLQYGLYIFNALVFFVGASLMVIGSLFLTIFKHEFHFAVFSVNFVAIAFIAIGAALILFVALGILTICKSNKILVVGHLLGLILAFAALATLGVWGLTIAYNGDLREKIHMELNNTISNYNQSDTTNEDTKEMNWLQRRFQCCGIKSYEDWDQFIELTEALTPIAPKKIDSLVAMNLSIHDVPGSCYKNETSLLGQQYPKLDDINTRGCLKPFYRYFSGDLKILCGVACFLALLTLISIGFLLFVSFKTNGDYSALTQSP